MTAVNFAPLFTWGSALCDSDRPSTARLVALVLSFHLAAGLT